MITIQIIQVLFTYLFTAASNTNKKGMTLVHSDDSVYSGEMLQSVIKQYQVHWSVSIIVLTQYLHRIDSLVNGKVCILLTDCIDNTCYSIVEQICINQWFLTRGEFPTRGEYEKFKGGILILHSENLKHCVLSCSTIRAANCQTLV